MPGKCYFRDYWLKDPNDQTIAKWLRPVNGDKFKAFCSLCNTRFDVSHSGFGSVKSHQKGKKHQELSHSLSSGMQKILPFSNPQSSKSEPLVSLPCASTNTTTLTSNKNSIKSYQIGDDVLKAEIIWSLNKVMTHSSDRSFGKCSDLFALMFPDSIIAQKFQLQKDKLAYIVTYGLGPYFQNQFLEELKKCEFFCISMDESLNTIAQKGQMDVVIRHWNEENNLVCTRYLTSIFLERSAAIDLLHSFIECMSKLGLSLKNILQI